MSAYICAVDVGTRSARAGLFHADGRLAAHGIAEFAVHEAPGGVAEYASAAIWSAICTAMRAAIAKAGVSAGQIRGLAFDATCSLVLTGQDNAPLPLGPEGRDTIAWFDHRAAPEAEACTATRHPLIAHQGGAMSPEMQTPKLMWLKGARPDLWERLGDAADLADHLTARAIGAPTVSACTLATKWPYLPAAGGWQDDFLQAVGLDDLAIGTRHYDAPVPVGSSAGTLAAGPAADLGLAAGIPVAAGLVDAFAGALGQIGADAEEDGDGAVPVARRGAVIGGTSSCIMAITDQPVFAAGLWGPYRDALLPGRWVIEGGQSAAGALLDHVLDLWAGTGAAATHEAVQYRIAELLAQEGADLGRDIHILPDFNGNRSPFAQAGARGAISGLSLDRSFDALCRLYWRAAVALALGLRQIAETMGAAGLQFASLGAAGGMARSDLLLQLLADATGLPIIRSEPEQSVLLGTAMNAAAAAGLHDGLAGAARAMRPAQRRFDPDRARREALQRDYQALRMMQRHRQEIARL